MKTLVFIIAFVSTYIGRVVDQNGEPVPYATVYPEIAPEWGTATNNDGFFRFEANLTKDSRIIVSCIGYEKKTVLAESLYSVGPEDGLYSVVLKEQPIALEETVIAAKKSKQRNKRKQMAALLHAVYVKLEEQFPDNNAQYRVVSDARMLSDGSTWGMEQMIANIVVLPEQAREGRDSVQFQGRFCKRFFDARKRAQADSILASDALERMEQKSAPKGAPANMLRKAANAVDSGVVVHRALFAIGNMRYDLVGQQILRMLQDDVPTPLYSGFAHVRGTPFFRACGGQGLHSVRYQTQCRPAADAQSRQHEREFDREIPSQATPRHGGSQYHLPAERRARLYS